MSTPEELAYAQSVRALDNQARAVDELRARTGVLLAAASIVASFLGAAALRGSNLDDALVGLGLLAFLGVVGLAICILWPRRRWTFAMSATVLLEDWVDIERPGGLAAMQRQVAEKMEGHWDANQVRLNHMFVLFELAAGAVGLEVLFWTVKLA
jgi:hypothetical protein